MFVWRRIALMMGVGLITIGITSSVFAQQGGGSGLSISPTRTELVIPAGKTDVVKLSLRNVSGQDVTAKVIVSDFQSDDQTGEPKIIVDDNNKSPYTIKPFLRGVKDIAMKKDEKADFDIPVEIPANVSPGAYFGVVRYTAVPLGEDLPQDNKVALTASVGSLVLIEVPGNITEQIQVSSVKVSSGDKSGSFFFKSPDKVAVDIKNNGNSFSKPFGKVSLSKGGKEVYTYELNKSDPKSNILPGSSRTFTDKLENVKSPGRYTLTANISHGKGGEVLTHSASFWYIPQWFAIVLLVALLVLLAVIYMVYRRRFGKTSRSTKRNR